MLGREPGNSSLQDPIQTKLRWQEKARPKAGPPPTEISEPKTENWVHPSSFAVIEIFAFSTFDTGQPFSAASAYF